MSYKTVNFYKTIDLYKAFNICKALNIYKALNIRKALNIYKILLLLDGYSGTYRVSKVYEDKAGRPVLDAEEVITLLSINAKA